MSESLDGLPASYRPYGISNEEWEDQCARIVDELVDGYDKTFKQRLIDGDDVAHVLASTVLLSAGTEAEFVGEVAWHNSPERDYGLLMGDPHVVMTEVKVRHTRLLYDQAVRDPFKTQSS